MVMTDEAKLQRKIKRILKPVLSVAGHHRYGKCELCGIETSWQINGHFVCPVCCLAQGFVGKEYDYGSCEICGKTGEWVCGEEDQYSLCHRHRDAWLDWKKRDFILGIDFHELPEAEKDALWDKCFNTFVQEAKAERSEAER